MNWIFWALLSLFFISTSSILQLAVTHNLKKFEVYFLFTRLIFIIAGIISVITFFIPGLHLNHNLLMEAKKNISPLAIIASGICLYLGITFKIFAFNKGGSLTLVIISFSLIINILFGTLFLKEKINIKIIIGIISFVLSAIYIIYNKHLLSKKL